MATRLQCVKFDVKVTVDRCVYTKQCLAKTLSKIFNLFYKFVIRYTTFCISDGKIITYIRVNSVYIYSYMVVIILIQYVL